MQIRKVLEIHCTTPAELTINVVNLTSLDNRVPNMRRRSSFIHSVNNRSSPVALLKQRSFHIYSRGPSTELSVVGRLELIEGKPFLHRKRAGRSACLQLIVNRGHAVSTVISSANRINTSYRVNFFHRACGYGLNSVCNYSSRQERSPPRKKTGASANPTDSKPSPVTRHFPGSRTSRKLSNSSVDARSPFRTLSFQSSAK